MRVVSLCANTQLVSCVFSENKSFGEFCQNQGTSYASEKIIWQGSDQQGPCLPPFPVGSVPELYPCPYRFLAHLTSCRSVWLCPYGPHGSKPLYDSNSRLSAGTVSMEKLARVTETLKCPPPSPHSLSVLQGWLLSSRLLPTVNKKRDR